MPDSSETTGQLPGELLAQQLEREGIVPLDEEERMVLLGLREVFATREEVRDTCLFVALQIVRDERRLQQEDPENYKPPVVISMLNGAIAFTSMVLEFTSEYGLELDPIYINPSAYGVEQTAGKTEISKDFTAEELERLSGRRILLFDEVLETSNTLRDTMVYIESRLEGRVWVKRKMDDGTTSLVEVQLKRPESIEVAILWNKEPEKMLIDVPKYVGATCPKYWIVGTGCDTKDPVTGDGVGRFAILGGISQAQP